MRKRIGNDFHFLWIIKDNGQTVDISEVDDFTITIKSQNGEEITPPYTLVNGSPLVQCNKEQLGTTGLYVINASWRVEDSTFSDGFRDCAADVDAFEIVQKSAQEIGELVITTDIAIGYYGKNAYEVWVENGNAGKTYEDYVAFLQKPSNDAAVLANTATGNANAAAEQAITAANLANAKAAQVDAAAALATTAANTANSIAALADTAASDAIEAAVEANNAAENANTAAAIATTAATAASNAASQVIAATDKWVGVIINPTLSSSESAPKSTVVAYRATELKRTGNLYHHTFGKSRIFNAFQMAVVVRSTKKVAWYLDKNNPSLRADGTPSIPDWTIHNICVIVPDLYRRIKTTDGATQSYEIAYDIAPFDGANLFHAESAHSIGFATMDRTATQLVSVISQDVRFRGGDNTAAKDALLSTQLGRPATQISRINFENYAAAAGWETGNIADRTLWHELTALYFANTNIQLDFTTTLTADGYPQGGLGNGVTTWNGELWNRRNGYFPIHNIGEGAMTIGCNVGVKNMVADKYYVGIISSLETGKLKAAGSFATGAGWSASYIGYTVQNLQTLAEATITGKTDNNTLTLSADIFQTAGQWYWIKGVVLNYQIPVFFGLEHLFGEIRDWVSGVNIEKSAEIANGGTGESKAYICTDFSKRAATITADYSYLGIVPRTDGYIKELYRFFAVAKTVTGASSSTFMSDVSEGYSSIPAVGSTVYGLLFGGNAYYGVSAGVRYSFASYVPTFSIASFGARLRAKIEK